MKGKGNLHVRPRMVSEKGLYFMELTEMDAIPWRPGQSSDSLPAGRTWNGIPVEGNNSRTRQEWP